MEQLSNIDLLRWAFGDATFVLVQVAVRGALLAWGVFMGRLFATGFFEHPKPMKVGLISMPIMVLIAAGFAFYGFKLVVNPGETRLEAIRDAEVTFFLVLLPLWAGCIWGMVRPVRDEGKKETETQCP